MGKIVLYAVLTGTSITALARPWVGVVATYVFIILTPQDIWWWNFEAIRPVDCVLIPTIIGFVIAFIQGKLDFSVIKNKRTLYIAGLWLAFFLSYSFGPYVNVSSRFHFFEPAWVLSLVHKYFILYFLASMCIDSERKLKWLVLVMVFSAIYLTWWANDLYLFQGHVGRIGGPASLSGKSIYADENAFAMFFVTALPFVYYLGLYYKKRILRYGLWLVIPFAWHAIFLTGSRGGLVALAVTILMIAFRSPKRIVGFLLIPIFVGAFMWQAGDIMKTRALTIMDYTEEASAANRIEAWNAAVSMIKKHPLTGVGLASFGAAFPHHSKKEPREAHNTFLQITAEAGVISGLMYVLIFVSSIICLRKNAKNLRLYGEKQTNDYLYCMNEAFYVAFTGLIVCSLFASLQHYEIFYFMCVLINTLLYISSSVGISYEKNRISFASAKVV